jgi:hypothetical protein
MCSFGGSAISQAQCEAMYVSDNDQDDIETGLYYDWHHSRYWPE